MKRKPQIVRTVDLDHEQMWVFDGGPQARLRVLYGSTWLTGEGDADDSIVRSGSERPLRPGRTLIEALAPSRVQIVERSSRSRLTLREAWRALRRFVRRQQFGAIAGQPQC